MYYVYFLKSAKNGFIYVGSCEDLDLRLKRHNDGLVRSTKSYRPWKIVGFEKYITRSEAVRKEKFFKTGQQKELLRKRFKDI